MMFEIASLIVVNLIIAAIIGFVVGYIIAKSKYSKIDSIEGDNKDLRPETKAKSGINPIFKKNSKLDFKPLILSSPKPIGKDNLKKIKGIGKKLAKIISDYREEHGYFKDIEDLKNIEGIGKNKFAQLKSRLKIGE